MPKNKGKGGKNRRRGKNENDNEKRELTFKEEGQEYAQVVKMLGYVNHCYIPGDRVRDKTARHYSRRAARLPLLDKTPLAVYMC